MYDNKYNNNDNGSYVGGLLLGLFLGIVGLIIAIAINKEDTRRGAITGFIIELVCGLSIGGCCFVVFFLGSQLYV